MLEYGAGDTSVGGVFFEGSLNLAGRINDLTIEGCTFFANAQIIDVDLNVNFNATLDVDPDLPRHLSSAHPVGLRDQTPWSSFEIGFEARSKTGIGRD